MKSILALAIIISVSACADFKDIDPYHPARPADVPLTTCDGTPIEWNWEKQRAYTAGRLFFERDSSGCVIAVIRKIK